MAVVEKISFQSEGSRIVGELYIPDSYKKGDRLPGIVISPNMTTVKEQPGRYYARKLSDKSGLVMLSFDHRNWGESEGEPRFLEDPYKKSEDISNAVSFLGTRKEVDPARIGGLAMCAGSGYMVYTSVVDRRIKAVATISGVFDLQGYIFGIRENAFMGQGKEAAMAILGMAAQGMQKYYETGEAEYVPALPDSNELTGVRREFWGGVGEYFLTEGLGYHANYNNKLCTMSFRKVAGFSAFPMAKLLTPTPLLMLVGSKALTVPSSQRLFDEAEDPKEIFVVDGAAHADMFHIDKYVDQATEKLDKFYSGAFK